MDVHILAKPELYKSHGLLYRLNHPGRVQRTNSAIHMDANSPVGVLRQRQSPLDSLIGTDGL